MVTYQLWIGGEPVVLEAYERVREQHALVHQVACGRRSRRHRHLQIQLNHFNIVW